MSARGRRPPGDGESFSESIQDVKRIEKDNRMPPKPPARPSPLASDEAPSEFVVEREGERIFGRALDVAPKHVRYLRAGDVEIERRIDLHGMDATAARDAVHVALDAAHAADERCILVVHGRGHHSHGAAVLKDALPGWLAEAPFGARIMAFASAAPRDGDVGATYVLLRRIR